MKSPCEYNTQMSYQTIRVKGTYIVHLKYKNEKYMVSTKMFSHKNGKLKTM